MQGMYNPSELAYLKCASTMRQGYRVYCAKCDDVLIFLLAGGDKRSQAADIKTALDLTSKFNGTV